MNISSPQPSSHPLPLWLRLSSICLLGQLPVILIAVRLYAETSNILIVSLAAAFLGTTLSLPLSLAFERLFDVIYRLAQQQPIAPLAWKRFGPLANEAARLNTLALRMAETTALRAGWLAQVQETAAQQERNRLARDLHDSIKQQLFSLQMSLAAAQAHWELDAVRAQSALQDARQNAQEALAEMNALLQQLSPAPLERVGLVQALRDQCEALGYRSGATVSVEVGALPDEAHLPPGAQESLFRIAQEALSNIARHARASQVRLSLGLSASRQALELHIQDDGLGFNPQTSQAGMGLSNMRQRAQALGGQLTVASASGKGANVQLSIPLLSPFDVSEETMSQADHTLNKAFAAGLIGGLGLIALLYYPLYVVLPGRYVPGWPAGQPMLSLGLQAAAVLSAIATGHLGARWAKAGARPANVLSGALSGCVAGVILFFGLAGSSAGVAGNVLLLQNGPFPVLQSHGLIMLVDAIRSTTQLCYGAFWLLFVAGAGLGALGGLLAPQVAPAAHRAEPLHAGRSILTAASLGGAVALSIVVTIYWLLEPAAQRAVTENTLALPPGPALSTITFWPFATATLLYLSALTGLYLLLRREVHQADALRLVSIPGQAYFYASVALISSLHMGGLLRSNEIQVGGLPAIIVSALGSLALSILLALAGRQAEQRARQDSLFLPPGRFDGAVFILGSALITILAGRIMTVSTYTIFIYIYPLILIFFGLALAIRQWRAWKKQQDAGLQARLWALFLQDYRSSIAGAAFVMLTTLFINVPHALSLVMITIPFIAPVLATSDNSGAISSTQLVQSLYVANANLLLAALALCAAIIGIVGIIAILVRRRLPEADHS